jgi:hypothetical protein
MLGVVAAEGSDVGSATTDSGPDSGPASETVDGDASAGVPATGCPFWDSSGALSATGRPWVGLPLEWSPPVSAPVSVAPSCVCGGVSLVSPTCVDCGSACVVSPPADSFSVCVAAVVAGSSCVAVLFVSPVASGADCPLVGSETWAPLTLFGS